MLLGDMRPMNLMLTDMIQKQLERKTMDANMIGEKTLGRRYHNVYKIAIGGVYDKENIFYIIIMFSNYIYK